MSHINLHITLMKISMWHIKLPLFLDAQRFLDAAWMNVNIWHKEFTFSHGKLWRMVLHIIQKPTLQVIIQSPSKKVELYCYVMKGLWWLHIDFTLWSLDQQAVWKLRENHKTWWLVDCFLPCQQTKVSKGEYSFFITMTTVKRYFGHNEAGRHTDQDL